MRKVSLLPAGDAKAREKAARENAGTRWAAAFEAKPKEEAPAQPPEGGG